VDAEQLERFIETSPVLVDDVTERVDEGEVLRYLGYPTGRAPGGQIRSEIGRWIEQANQQAEPQAVYVVLPVLEKAKNRLRVQSGTGAAEFRGAIGRFLGGSRLIVAFIATAGPKIEQLASRLMAKGEDLPAMIVNAVGAERAEAAEAVVIERLRKKLRVIEFSTTLPYSPGYCGMALTEQNHLFGLFCGETAGVTLTRDCLMRPIKSVSGLMGLAPKAEVKENGSPCDRCELHTCNMRR